MSVPRRTPRRPALAVVAAALLAGSLSAVPSAGSAAEPARPAEPAAPGFLAPTTTRGAALPVPRSVAGQRSLVTLRTSLLPSRAESQPIRFDLGGQSVTGRFTHIERSRYYTAWTGKLDVDSGSFSIVRAGSTYRASIVWPHGLFEVTQARGSRYWLTAVAPYAGPPSGNDATTRTASPSQRALMAASTTAPVSERGRSRIDVLFAYTPSAKLAAGGKAALKAAVGQAAAVTNFALTNSGIKAQIRVKGIVKVKGHESNNVLKDLRRLQRAHDGAFDGALRARTKHHADIVHLLTGGPADRLCGAGAEPRTLREATPLAGASNVVRLVPALHRGDPRDRPQPGRRPHLLPRRHALLADPGLVRVVRRPAPLPHDHGLLRPLPGRRRLHLCADPVVLQPEGQLLRVPHRSQEREQCEGDQEVRADRRSLRPLMAGPEFDSPPDLPTPFGYSHVVGLPAGRLVWTSGQVAIDTSGQVPDGWEAQTRLVFENVGRALAAQGAGWSDVVKLTYFVTGVEQVTTVRSVRDEFVDTDRPPTSSLVQVAGLFRPDLLDRGRGGGLAAVIAPH